MATVRQRRLATELKELRNATNLEQREVADRLQVSLSTVQRIERAAFLPKLPVLRAMLVLYGADSARSAMVMDLWQQARQRGWWISYGDVLAGTYVGLEDEATTIRTYEGFVVPGLLQTEEYARSLLEGIRSGDSKRNQRIVEARAVRRTRFNGRDDPPTLHVILGEAALRQQVGGPDIMRDQIFYLKAQTRRPNVTIQIVPFGHGAHPGMSGSFVLLGFAEETDPVVCYVESRAGDLFPEDELLLAGLSATWDRLVDTALTPEESAGMLADLLKE